MSRRLRLGWSLLWAALAACQTSGGPALSADERVLVATYVRIAVLDAWRADEPDSARIALDRLAAEPDSAAVRRALAGLEAAPERWEAVWDAISKQLGDLEKQPAPGVALRVLDGRPPGAAKPRRTAPEVQAPPQPARPRLATADSVSAAERAKRP